MSFHTLKVLDSLSFEQVADEWIEQYQIKEGTFDTISNCKYTVPSAITIGRVYQQLVLSTAKENEKAQAIIDVFSLFISDEISNFNSNVYYSTGLILTDPDTGKEGITLAAILLFGKDSTIMSVLPQYKTDAIYRVKNLDRYDDREVIITNLVDSFRKLMDFGKKHLNDVFVTEGDQSISARDKILREVVSNIFAHRDYSNGYTAQFVIERDKLYTKNSNLTHFRKIRRFRRCFVRLVMRMNWVLV